MWRGMLHAAATSAPGLGSLLSHLHRDWAHPGHICAGLGSPLGATRRRRYSSNGDKMLMTSEILFVFVLGYFIFANLRVSPLTTAVTAVSAPTAMVCV